MAYENGVDWKPVSPERRGRHRTFVSALDAACADLMTERTDFFDSLADVWSSLFPGLAAKPGRYEDGKIFLYVKSAPASFGVRPKLRAIAARLAKLVKGLLCHVNLIPVNPTEETDFMPSAPDRIREWIAILEKEGVPATLRRTLCADIASACGQLRRERQIKEQ